MNFDELELVKGQLRRELAEGRLYIYLVFPGLRFDIIKAVFGKLSL